jgi:predicted methyltransferase
MIMNLDYHDVYWQSAERKIGRMEPQEWLKALYAAMKPGAVVGIIDHVAAPNDDARAVVEKLHRIDPAIVRADFERAGFVFEAESDMLRNPADDHTLNVFDEKIRGKTDRFVFRFRKPA